MIHTFLPKPKKFEEVNFLLKCHQNRQVLKRRSVEKREREKVLRKRKEGKREKGKREEEKEKLQEYSNKGEVNILRGEKHFNFKNLLLM
jgi:hypothetical protein